MPTIRSTARLTAAALTVAAATLVPLPASATTGSITAMLESTGVLEPAWGETITAPVTVRLQAPAPHEVTLTVGFTLYTGNPDPYAWQQTRSVTIGAGETTAVPGFTITGDDRDVAATYVARIIDAPAEVRRYNTVYTPVTDTTRDGELFCNSAGHVDLVEPTEYDGTPGFCSTEVATWGSVRLPDGSGTLTGVTHHTTSNIVAPYRTAPAVGDFGRSSGDVASATWSMGTLSIEAWGMHTEAAATCTSLGGEPSLALASSIDRIVIRQATGVPGAPDAVLDLGPIDEPRSVVLGEWLIAMNHSQIFRDTASGPWMNGAPQPKVAATQYAVYVERQNPRAPYWAALAKSSVAYPNGSPCNA